MNAHTVSTGLARISFTGAPARLRKLTPFEKAIVAARRGERVPFACSCGHYFARIAAAFGGSR